MRKILLKILVLALFASIAEAQFIREPKEVLKKSERVTVSEVVDGIQKYYDLTYGLSAIFVQEATIKSVKKVQTSKGKVYFKKPGKMAWIYEEPTRQQIISDGLYLWMYMPESKQVIKNRTNQAFLTNTPQNFLSGFGNIKQDFNVRYDARPFDEQGNILLVFEPRKPMVNMTKLFVTAKPIDYKGERLYQILQTTIYDQFGNMNKITFYNIDAYDATSASAVPETVFHFVPPADVKVIEPPATLRPQ
ncbi:MAG: hypothetical protein OHK0040_06640 [bacterium]